MSGPVAVPPALAGRELDVAALGEWLTGAGFAGPFEVSRLAGGQSNPTYRVRSPQGDHVLRTQPPGDLLPSAHAIDREYRVLSTLAGSAVPVPQPLRYCPDRAVLGRPFYLMSFVPGQVFTDPALPGLTPAQRGAAYASMADVLAALHAVDWQAAGLADYGRPDHFVARQLARWGGQYEATRTADEPAMRRLRDWLDRNTPDDERAAIAHGDYRIGNLVYGGDPPRVTAVLDWELSTIGHPMSDLAYTCMAYHLPPGDDVSPGLAGLDLAVLGIPDEAGFLQRYADRSGIDPIPYWRFYLVFSLYRTAAIQHGVHIRYLNGPGSHSGAHFGESYRRIAAVALRLIE